MSTSAAESIQPHLDRLPVTPVLLEGHIDPVDVAWGSGDIFRSPATSRHFFGAARSSPTLRWLHTSAAGVDAPVFAELSDRGVTLTTSHVTGPPIAEYVLRAVLDWFQRAEEWREAAREHAWREHEFREVLGTTWLIVGLGSIGREVAIRARAFGAQVIGTRRAPRGDEPVDELVAPDRLLDAVPRADVVVLAAPATPETIGIVDAEFLGRMRPGSVLVNVARGSLVVESDLLAALDAGLPAAALIDVASSEPVSADSLLWVHPRVVLTAHSSGLGDGRHARAASIFVTNLERFVEGEPLVNVVRDRALIG